MSFAEDETCEFDDCVCVSETAKAILVRCGDKQCWVPKSQVSDDSEVYGYEDAGKLIVKAWFAEKEGLFE